MPTLRPRLQCACTALHTVPPPELRRRLRSPDFRASFALEYVLEWYAQYSFMSNHCGPRVCTIHWRAARKCAGAVRRCVHPACVDGSKASTCSRCTHSCLGMNVQACSLTGSTSRQQQQQVALPRVLTITLHLRVVLYVDLDFRKHATRELEHRYVLELTT